MRRRREQIVKAALKAFSRRGFHRTTVREIAKVARLSTGSIYDYVRRKEDILFLIYEKIMVEMSSIMETETKSDDSLDQQLRRMLNRILKLADKYQDLILVIFQESRNFKKEHLRAMLIKEANFIKVFEDLLERAKEKGLIRASDPKLAGNIISFLTLLGVLRRWKLRNEFNRDQLIDGIIEFVFQGLGARCDHEST